jgi:hypothetical protein
MQKSSAPSWLRFEAAAPQKYIHWDYSNLTTINDFGIIFLFAI